MFAWIKKLFDNPRYFPLLIPLTETTADYRSVAFAMPQEFITTCGFNNGLLVKQEGPTFTVKEYNKNGREWVIQQWATFTDPAKFYAYLEAQYMLPKGWAEKYKFQLG